MTMNEECSVEAQDLIVEIQVRIFIKIIKKRMNYE